MHEIKSFGQKKKAKMNVESKTQNAQQPKAEGKGANEFGRQWERGMG